MKINWLAIIAYITTISSALEQAGHNGPLTLGTALPVVLIALGTLAAHKAPSTTLRTDQ